MYPIFDSLDSEKKTLILKHLDAVIEANKVVNLTRIDNLEQAMLLHVEDSLSGLPELLEAPEGVYGDLGSGAGYPGIPLAIVSGRETVLVDSRQKKMLVVESIIEELGLKDKVSVCSQRAELLARKQPESFSVLTARALAKVGVLLELASPLLKVKGKLICYKANVDDKELEDAERVAHLVGMSLVSDRQFLLEDNQRRILTYEKVSRSKVKLPRKEGQAQKNPL